MPKTYSQKLRDPRWQKKRLEVLERDSWSCQACLSDKNTLQVHHIRYHKGEPWDAPNEDLTSLCEACHKRVERLKIQLSYLICTSPWLRCFEDLIALISNPETRDDTLNVVSLLGAQKWFLKGCSDIEKMSSSAFGQGLSQGKAAADEAREDGQ